ncbi:hypothetical protein PG985_010250 [Apiospora marii]|uniref:LysM domain-containing protein n=1 Tax=Apiospora marii TaxID=335849 RepID=A0ABR1RLE5_9PEZI
MRLIALTYYALALGLADAYLVAPDGTPAPGAASSCSAWVQNSYALTCDKITTALGMTQDQFQSWNPSVTQLGPGCNMIKNMYYCVQVNFIKTTPTATFSRPDATTTATSRSGTTTGTVTSTSTSTGNGVSTPTPTQTGMAGNCNKFYRVVGGDTCGSIATSQGIPLTDLYAWNQALGSTCSGLWTDYYVCVGVVGSTTQEPTTTTFVTSTKTAGNGVTTPTPVRAGMADNCNAFHLVVSGDGCYDIAAAAGVSLDDFYDWNPDVGKGTCDSLWGGYYVCVGIVSSSTSTRASPTTTRAGNGVVTPTPVQTGMVQTCKRFHSVVAGDSCYDIAAGAGISLDTFYSWNPAIGSDCGSLWVDYNVCTAVL